jgi:hypothetical protein
VADAPHVDRPFRRSLFILLVTIGVISTASMFGWRDARSDLRRSESQRAAMAEQLSSLLGNQAQLLSQFNAATETAAIREGAAARRQKELEAAMAAFLAGSSDPAVSNALVSIGVQPDPRHDRRRPSPQPTPTRSSQPKPKPKPKPKPTCVAAVVCVPPTPSNARQSP